MKRFHWKVLICVAPLLLGALMVGRAVSQYRHNEGGFKLGVDLKGGTILVYEADPEKTPPDFRIDQLAERLKRRIDPADLYNVTVRPVPPNRVEIVMPTGGGEGTGSDEAAAGPGGKKNMSSEHVEKVKELISRVGSLRFVILANARDDKEAIEAARKMFANVAADPKLAATLAEDRYTGKPPPPPAPPDGETFNTPLGRFTYSWIELGPKMRKQYNLDNAAEGEPARSSLWKQFAEARKENRTVEVGDLLMFSREVPAERDARLPKRDQGRKVEYFVLTRDSEKPTSEHEVTGNFLSRAYEGPGDRGGLAVHFTFNTEGGNRFYDLTSKNKPDGGFYRHLAIVLDELVMTAPTINSPIRTEGQITGEFTKEEVDSLVNILRSGALPATLKPLPVSENTIAPTLGNYTIKWGTISVALAFLAVIVFMIIYYRLAGVVACVALLANLLLTVAVMAAVHATFTLPGLAGLVLMLGMAVDANVLIYERLREERDRGAALPLAIRNAYDRSLPTIIDTHLSSIFTAVVLYIVGNDQLKGFGISLTLGLVVSLFTSLFMTHVMFDWFLQRGWLKDLKMMRLFSRPNIDFMKWRYRFFAATVGLTILGGALFIWRLDKGGLNIDFTGGTLYSGTLAKPVSLDALSQALGEDVQEKRLQVADVQEVEGSKGYSFLIRYEGDERPRRVDLPNPDTAENVRRRASHLEGWSLEQTYTEGSTGGLSTLFTVRTSEKAPELLQAAINRLLDDPANQEVRLQRISMTAGDIAVDPETKKQVVTLNFADPSSDAPAYASESQVRRLLEREFRQSEDRTLANQAQLFVLVGDKTTEQGGRFTSMKLTLNPVPEEALKKALANASKEFSDRPQPERLENFDSVLARETQTRALYAILASWGAILLYLWFRFGNWTFGLAAVLCLVHDLFFTLGIIAACHWLAPTFLGRALLLQDFKIDLATVAALLTLVGYSVNDTIVVFDRIREVRGKNPDLSAEMINSSINQTLSRTILASVTVFLVVLVLYIFGGEGVHLFAFVMVVGVVVGTYSSIYVASPLLLVFGEGQRGKAGQARVQAAPAR